MHRSKKLLLTIIVSVFLLLYLNYSQSYIKNKFLRSPIHILESKAYPGSFVANYDLNHLNTSYCNFNFGLPNDLRFLQSAMSTPLELKNDSPYRVLYNVIRAEKSARLEELTYATHVSSDFVNYVAELARDWDGYISVAAYVTAADFISTLNQLNQFCYCLPQMTRVSVHLIFHKELAPIISNTSDLIIPEDCDVKEQQELIRKKAATPLDLADVYPINVCRNAARHAAQTQFVLVSDAQLIPSEKLAVRFLKMIEKNKKNRKNNDNTVVENEKKVYVLPVFEVEEYEMVPRTKDQLLRLIRLDKAVYFHRLVCAHCQKFPMMEKWFVSRVTNYIKIFNTVKREIPYNRWEPIYIGTKDEPLYHEILSWEGLQDKMAQMLEMCLIGYKFAILDGAFLVHWPGIKRKKSRVKLKWRIPFQHENTRQYNKILKQLASKYPPNPQCKLQ